MLNMLLNKSFLFSNYNSPLDEIIDELGGPDGVAEMTGRRGRIVRRSPKEIPAYEVRGQDSDSGIESLNVKEVGKETHGGNVLFNDALNTFYLRLYGVGHNGKGRKCFI